MSGFKRKFRMFRYNKKLLIVSALFIWGLLSGCGPDNNIETNKETDSESNKEVASETKMEITSEEELLINTESDSEDESLTQQVSEKATNMDAINAIVELSDVQSISDNKYTCSFENVKHDFIVYLPEDSDNAPFIIMLHGYGESGEGFCNKVHLEEEACERGFAVIYVDGASDPNDATSSSGWNSGIGKEGNNDVGFLCSLAKYLQKEYSLSSDRAYAVGFSNGAFMTHRLAMEASDVFAGVVSVAGKMPESVWNSKSSKNNISFFQITGDKDDVIPKNSDGSSKFAKDPAIEDVMDYWVSSNGLKLADQTEVGKGSVLTKYAGEGTDARTKVWNLQVKDGRHAWPDESVCGFDMNSLILDFLKVD